MRIIHWINRLILAIIMVVVGGCFVAAISGCVGTEILDVPPAVTSPVPAGTPSANQLVAYGRGDIPAHGSTFRDHYQLPFVGELILSGTAPEVCAAIALVLELSLFTVADAVPDSRVEDDGVDRDSAANQGYSLVWHGGDGSRLVAAVARMGIAMDIRDSILFCGVADTWHIVHPLSMSLNDAVVLLGVEIIPVGNVWLLRGDTAAVHRARYLIKDIQSVGLIGDTQFLLIPSGTDHDLLSAWMNDAGLTDDITRVGDYVLGQGYALAALDRYFKARPRDECVLRSWSFRTVRPDMVESLLPVIFPSTGYCSGDAGDSQGSAQFGGGGSGGGSVLSSGASGVPSPLISQGGSGSLSLSSSSSLSSSRSLGGGFHVDLDRGLLLASVRGEYHRRWLAALELVDPAPRPLVLRWLLINVSRDDRESVGLIFSEAAGFDIFNITNGLSIPIDLGDLSNTLSGTLSNSQASSSVSVAAPGVLGLPITAVSTRSVAFDGGAVVGEDGVIRESLERVNLGTSVNATVRRVRDGWSVDYGFTLSAPSPGGSFSSISRDGIVYVPDGEAVVLLTIADQSSSVNKALINYSGSVAVGDVYVMLQIERGYLPRAFAVGGNGGIPPVASRHG